MKACATLLRLCSHARMSTIRRRLTSVRQVRSWTSFKSCTTRQQELEHEMAKLKERQDARMAALAAKSVAQAQRQAEKAAVKTCVVLVDAPKRDGGGVGGGGGGGGGGGKRLKA